MKRLLPTLLGLCCIANAPAQFKVQSVLPHGAAPEKTAAAVYDSTANIRVGGDAAYYESLVGQRILFYPRDIHANLRPIAYFNFLAEQPAIVGIDTTWLRKPRKKVRPEDFRVDTLYSDVYNPRFFEHFGYGDITPLGCSLHEARGIGTLDYSGLTRSGWFTPAEAVEGQSFEILGIEQSKLEDSELLLFRLRDDAGKVLYWFAHMGEDETNLRDEYYPAVVEGLIGKYRAAYVGKDLFLTKRKPGAKGYVSEYFGLRANTMQGEETRLNFGTELRCTDIRLIGDGKGYAVPSFVFRTERGQRAALHSALPLPDALRNRRIHHRPGPRLPGRSGPHPFRSGIRPAGRRSASARRGAPAAGEGAEGAQGDTLPEIRESHCRTDSGRQSPDRHDPGNVP